MTGLDPVIPLEATHYPPIIGVGGTSPSMTFKGCRAMEAASVQAARLFGQHDRDAGTDGIGELGGA
jgi:hypothetical protein